jgi:Endoribonuclease L-PSP
MASSQTTNAPQGQQKGCERELYALSLKAVDCYHATLVGGGDAGSSITPERNMELLLDQLESTLAEVKLSMRDVFFVQLCIRDMTKFASMNAVYKTRYAPTTRRLASSLLSLSLIPSHPVAIAL